MNVIYDLSSKLLTESTYNHIMWVKIILMRSYDWNVLIFQIDSKLVQWMREIKSEISNVSTTNLYIRVHAYVCVKCKIYVCFTAFDRHWLHNNTSCRLPCNCCSTDLQLLFSAFKDVAYAFRAACSHLKIERIENK